jgi:two-component system KDP operon response regulator KdpE
VATPQAPVILVVDDTRETRALIRRLLQRAGMQVIEADSGEAAIRSIESARPDLVVLDLRLPGISGLDVARWVRMHPDPLIAQTVLLACSASTQPEVISEARDAGCDDFEGKPFDVPSFAPRIRDLLSRRSRS